MNGFAYFCGGGVMLLMGHYISDWRALLFGLACGALFIAWGERK